MNHSGGISGWASLRFHGVECLRGIITLDFIFLDTVVNGKSYPYYFLDIFSNVVIKSKQ